MQAFKPEKSQDQDDSVSGLECANKTKPDRPVGAKSLQPRIPPLELSNSCIQDDDKLEYLGRPLRIESPTIPNNSKPPLKYPFQAPTKGPTISSPSSSTRPAIPLVEAGHFSRPRQDINPHKRSHSNSSPTAETPRKKPTLSNSEKIGPAVPSSKFSLLDRVILVEQAERGAADPIPLKLSKPDNPDILSHPAQNPSDRDVESALLPVSLLMADATTAPTLTGRSTSETYHPPNANHPTTQKLVESLHNHAPRRGRVRLPDLPLDLPFSTTKEKPGPNETYPTTTQAAARPALDSAPSRRRIQLPDFPLDSSPASTIEQTRATVVSSAKESNPRRRQTRLPNLPLDFPPASTGKQTKAVVVVPPKDSNSRRRRTRLPDLSLDLLRPNAGEQTRAAIAGPHGDSNPRRRKTRLPNLPLEFPPASTEEQTTAAVKDSSPRRPKTRLPDLPLDLLLQNAGEQTKSDETYPSPLPFNPGPGNCRPQLPDLPLDLPLLTLPDQSVDCNFATRTRPPLPELAGILPTTSRGITDIWLPVLEDEPVQDPTHNRSLANDVPSHLYPASEDLSPTLCPDSHQSPSLQESEDNDIEVLKTQPPSKKFRVIDLTTVIESETEPETESGEEIESDSDEETDTRSDDESEEEIVELTSEEYSKGIGQGGRSDKAVSQGDNDGTSVKSKIHRFGDEWDLPTNPEYPYSLEEDPEDMANLVCPAWLKPHHQPAPSQPERRGTGRSTFTQDNIRSEEQQAYWKQMMKELGPLRLTHPLHDVLPVSKYKLRRLRTGPLENDMQFVERLFPSPPPLPKNLDFDTSAEPSGSGNGSDPPKVPIEPKEALRLSLDASKDSFYTLLETRAALLQHNDLLRTNYFNLLHVYATFDEAEESIPTDQ